MDSIRERLVKLQEIRNLSIMDMAKKCNINYRTMQDYLTQDRDHKVEVLQKIADAYNISIIWLIVGIGEMYNNNDDNKNKSMPQEFIGKLKKDLAGKDNSFYDRLVVMRDRIDQVLDGKAILTQYEVIDLASRLNQQIDHYVWLAGYKSEMIDKILGKEIVKSLLRKAIKLSDNDLDKLLEIMDMVLTAYINKQNR